MIFATDMANVYCAVRTGSFNRKENVSSWND